MKGLNFALNLFCTYLLIKAFIKSKNFLHIDSINKFVMHNNY